MNSSLYNIASFLLYFLLSGVLLFLAQFQFLSIIYFVCFLVIIYNFLWQNFDLLSFNCVIISFNIKYIFYFCPDRMFYCITPVVSFVSSIYRTGHFLIVCICFEIFYMFITISFISPFDCPFFAQSSLDMITTYWFCSIKHCNIPIAVFHVLILWSTLFLYLKYFPKGPFYCYLSFLAKGLFVLPFSLSYFLSFFLFVDSVSFCHFWFIRLVG